MLRCRSSLGMPWEKLMAQVAAILVLEPANTCLEQTLNKLSAPSIQLDLYKVCYARTHDGASPSHAERAWQCEQI